MAAPSPDRLVEIGIVGRPHGVRGELRVLLHNPGSDILERVERILVRPAAGSPLEAEPRAIAGVRRGPHAALLALEGICDRDGAERLKGARLMVPRAELPPESGDEFYVDDLVGLEVRCGGAHLGTVVGSREQGGIEIATVVVPGPDGSLEELEIPLVEDYVAALSLAEGVLDVRGIEDLPRHRARGRS